MATGFILNSVFDRLHAALQVVESIEGIVFATSAKYGYVTSCPSNLGTGMRASVHLKVFESTFCEHNNTIEQKYHITRYCFFLLSADSEFDGGRYRL